MSQDLVQRAAPPGLTGREYLRVSYDRSGRERSNEEQHADNADAGSDWGITTWADPYRDVGSASRFARKGRDDFDQLMEDLRGGTFGADVLVLWEGSRGSRELETWLPLLKACAAARVQIGVTNMERLFRPWKARDRHDLVDIANDAELEAAQTSERTTRSARRGAVDGRPHGRVPFGYRRTYDPSSGALAAQVPEPEEARVVVELYERLARGESLAGIARDFTRRGITSRGSQKVAPRPFSPQTLRGMALAPVYAGQRVHCPGDRVGRARRSMTAATTTASWPALVSDDLYYAVRARLTDPARVTKRAGRGVHLLSMLTTCDVCGSRMAATYKRGPRAYQCHDRGCVKVSADALDQWAERQVLGLLSREDVFDALVQEASTADIQTARDAVTRLRTERAELLARLELEDDDPEVTAALARRVGRQLQEAEQRVEELSTPANLRGLITPGEAAAQQWVDAPMAARREVVRELFAPGLLGALSVARQDPAVRTGHAPVEDRVRLDGQPLG